MNDAFPTPEQVGGMERVHAAWLRARRLSADSQEFLVGICDDGGRVCAAVTLNSFLQVRGFARRMGRLGYAPMEILGSAQQMQGCDVLLHPGAAPVPTDLLQAGD